jgi:rhamnulokinase
VKYYLAIDIGASSGRHILGHYGENGQLQIEEIYRFRTGLIRNKDGSLHWDIAALVNDVFEGLKKAGESGKVPSAIGIDTFGVDYALLDNGDNLIGDVVSYRDERTIAAKERFMDPNLLYMSTGIQPQNFDTAYQLYCDKCSGKLSKAKSILLLPSYLAYLLTGIKQNELSIMSTSALIDARTNGFSTPVMSLLGLDGSEFGTILEAGSLIGPFLHETAARVGYTANVYASLTHDTGSAFYCSFSQEGDVLLSSGTWSLLGAIIDKPIITDASYKAGFTNELSHKGEVRFLKNIMGMWLINRVKQEAHRSISIIELVERARRGTSFEETFDASDASLFSPDNMTEAIKALLYKQYQKLPKSDAELYYCIYHSLAKCYKKSIDELSMISNRKFTGICIFGGGSKNAFLNELTEKETGLPVHVGPGEATAIGNILSFAKYVK